MHFLNWLCLILLAFTPLFPSYGSEVDHFRQCTNCSVNELDTFFNETSAPYEAFKLIHSGGSKGAAVLFHGLGDSPYYMKDIAELYYRNGYDVYTPLLKAHGDSYKNLETVSYTEWNQQAETIIKDVSERYQNKVLLAGLSNGGLIGTVAALKSSVKNRIESLLLLSPAFGLPGSAEIKFRAFRTAEILDQMLDIPGLHSHFKRLLTIKVRTDLCYGCVGTVRYNFLPLNAPAQLMKNAANLKVSNGEEGITIPTIMVLTSDDKTISLSTAVAKFKSLFSGHKKLVWIQSNAPKTASVPKDIPPGQMTIIHSNDELSHVITLKSRGLARPDEVNSKFNEMSTEIESLFPQNGRACAAFYKRL